MKNQPIEDVVQEFENKPFMVTMKSASDFNESQHNFTMKMLGIFLTSLVQQSKEEEMERIKTQIDKKLNPLLQFLNETKTEKLDIGGITKQSEKLGLSKGLLYIRDSLSKTP